MFLDSLFLNWTVGCVNTLLFCALATRVHMLLKIENSLDFSIICFIPAYWSCTHMDCHFVSPSIQGGVQYWWQKSMPKSRVLVTTFSCPPWWWSKPKGEWLQYTDPRILHTRIRCWKCNKGHPEPPSTISRKILPFKHYEHRNNQITVIPLSWNVH